MQGPNGTILPWQFFNDTAEPLDVIYTITPFYSDSCEGNLVTYIVTVNPSVSMEPVDDLIICDGDEIFIEFTSVNSGGTMTYEWSSDLDIGFGTSGQGNINSTAVNTGTSPITAIVTLCQYLQIRELVQVDHLEIFTITVLPNGQVNQPDFDGETNLVVCNGDFVNKISFSSINQPDFNNGADGYSWSIVNGVSIGMNPSQGSTDSTPSFIADNQSSVPVIAIIEVLPNYTYIQLKMVMLLHV